MRVIEQAVQAVLRARKLHAAGEHTESAGLLDRTSESLVGLPPSALARMPLASLLFLLQSGHGLDVSKALVVAQILHQRGEVSTVVGDADRAHAFLHKALELYKEINRLAPCAPELAAHKDRVSALAHRLHSDHATA